MLKSAANMMTIGSEVLGMIDHKNGILRNKINVLIKELLKVLLLPSSKDTAIDTFYETGTSPGTGLLAT